MENPKSGYLVQRMAYFIEASPLQIAQDPKMREAFYQFRAHYINSRESAGESVQDFVGNKIQVIDFAIRKIDKEIEL